MLRRTFLGILAAIPFVRKNGLRWKNCGSVDDDLHGYDGRVGDYYWHKVPRRTGYSIAPFIPRDPWPPGAMAVVATDTRENFLAWVEQRTIPKDGITIRSYGGELSSAVVSPSSGALPPGCRYASTGYLDLG